MSEAYRWLGTPYHHQGRVIGAGVDCAMILCEVYYAAGLIPYIDPRPYPHDWHLHKSGERYMGWLDQYAQVVSAPLPGDVALYRFARAASHGAIVIEWPTVIHALLGEGVVLDCGERETFKNRLVGFWRLRGIDE